MSTAITSAKIRAFTADDSPQYVAMKNAVYPEYPFTIEELKHSDEHRDPRCFFGRYVAELDGTIVGSGVHTHQAYCFHPDKYYVEVSVHPDARRQGIGLALYEHLRNVLEARNPIALRSEYREDAVAGEALSARLGFNEEMRAWESRLDLAAFDAAPFPDPAGVVKHGVTIKTLRELMSEPEHRRKLYDLDMHCMEDMPSPEPVTPIDYDTFNARCFESPNLLPDGYFVAVVDATGEYVGINNLWSSQADNGIYNGLTGVHRDWRRKGLALALKLTGIAYAKREGFDEIKTWNDSTNQRMLAINVGLGFDRRPAWVNTVKDIDE